METPLQAEYDLTCGSRLDHFAENEELISIISTLPQVCGDMRPSENAIESFTGMYIHVELNT